MNYEKKYKEALERTKQFSEKPYLEDSAGIVEYIFPELKESEDERIREDIIRCLKYSGIKPDRPINPHVRTTMKDALAWLEKQDSYYTFEIEKGHWYKCVCDYMPNGSDLIFKHDRLYYCRSDWRLIGEINARNVKDIGVNGYKSFFRPATNQEIKDWLEKQGEQKPAWSEEDERILDAIVTSLNNEYFTRRLESLKGIGVSPVIDWLKSLKKRL